MNIKSDISSVTLTIVAPQTEITSIREQIEAENIELALDTSFQAASLTPSDNTRYAGFAVTPPDNCPDTQAYFIHAIDILREILAKTRLEKPVGGSFAVRVQRNQVFEY